jgi:hypothetical protein
MFNAIIYIRDEIYKPITLIYIVCLTFVYKNNFIRLPMHIASQTNTYNRILIGKLKITNIIKN